MKKERLIDIQKRIDKNKADKSRIIKEIKKINKRFESGKIGSKEYNSFFTKRVGGRSRLHWIDFYNRLIERDENMLREEHENFRGLAKNIKRCKRGRRAIQKRLQRLDKDYREEYSGLLNQRMEGKTRHEWLEYCGRYINKNETNVKSYEVAQRTRIFYDAKILLPAAAVLCALLIIGIMPGGPTGFAVLGNSTGNFKPACIDSWQCSQWSECLMEGIQTRECRFEGDCQRDEDKPQVIRECIYYGSCLDGVKDGNEEGVDCGGGCGVCNNDSFSPPDEKADGAFILLLISLFILLLEIVSLVRHNKKINKQGKFGN
jgi:hypothetical protein